MIPASAFLDVRKIADALTEANCVAWLMELSYSSPSIALPTIVKGLVAPLTFEI
jgi:hypothetical protein